LSSGPQRERKLGAEVDRPFTVLFVCTGNTCRSPMAEGILRSMLKQQGHDELVQVLSAGIAACPGLPASPYAVAAAAEDNLDISSHRSRLLDAQLVAQADMVLGMSPEHVEFATSLAPDPEKITTLKEFGSKQNAPLDVYIPDPMGGSITMFRASYREIRHEIQRMYPELLEHIQKKRQGHQQ